MCNLYCGGIHIFLVHDHMTTLYMLLRLHFDKKRLLFFIPQVKECQKITSFYVLFCETYFYYEYELGCAILHLALVPLPATYFETPKLELNCLKMCLRTLYYCSRSGGNQIYDRSTDAVPSLTHTHTQRTTPRHTLPSHMAAAATALTTKRTPMQCCSVNLITSPAIIDTCTI